MMIVKTPGSQMGSPAAAGEGGEAMGGGRGKSGERREVQSRSLLTSTASKARSRSREVATLDEALRILPSTTAAFAPNQVNNGGAANNVIPLTHLVAMF